MTGREIVVAKRATPTNSIPDCRCRRLADLPDAQRRDEILHGGVLTGFVAEHFLCRCRVCDSRYLVMRVLIVDQDPQWRGIVRTEVTTTGRSTLSLEQGNALELYEVECLERASELVGRGVDLLVTESWIGQESTLALVNQAATLAPRAPIIVMSLRDNASEAFSFARGGACAYLAKPFSGRAFREALTISAAKTQGLEASARAQVGHVPIFVAQDIVRRSMVLAALHATAGNISRAAILLGVTRAAVQQMRRRYQIVCPLRSAGSTTFGPETMSSGLPISM